MKKVFSNDSQMIVFLTVLFIVAIIAFTIIGIVANS